MMRRQVSKGNAYHLVFVTFPLNRVDYQIEAVNHSVLARHRTGRQAKVVVGNSTRRSTMRPIDEPELLTTDERFSEIASIFAKAILRLRALAALSEIPQESATSENSPKSPSTALEVSASTVLSVHNG
jgi:hypothetical protein